ncbi:sulfatase-like hydrolase/transferase [Vibrio campbellii]|uniref:sulfatase-like hydrolase/transferase n=1 Tax=Vibrio campbellii TaxID=680 RepID=UPI001E641E6B|nr:sulfatase-like hydrolase/transferase [Vibrio campbellii]MCC8255728.1 sulfatase-like hydrolase/transferase [Vibrio campbellii CAIM 333]
MKHTTSHWVTAFSLLFISTCFVVPSFASTLSRAEATSKNMQPDIPRKQQEQETGKILSELATKHGKRPNIIWLLVDDLGYGDIGGVWGGGDVVGAATPNIDKLAAEGLALTSVYSQPTCTPTRSAMMLGRLPIRTGLIRPILAGDKVAVNPWEGEASIGQLLSDAGYHTVLTGKWHTGEEEGMRPWEVGFDEFQGYYASQKEITQQFDDKRYPDLVLDEEKAAAFKKAAGHIDMFYGQKGKGQDVVEETTSIEQFVQADQKLMDFTVDKIKALSKEDKPFFIYHNFLRVHADNYPSKEFKGASESKYPYKDNVVEVDYLVGEVMKALADAGIEENTFVFFTSDNGPQRDTWPDSGYTPFRGGKASAWEGGVRVPGIAYWKGVIQPRHSTGLFDLMDLFNTSLTLGGVTMDTLPTDRYYDGIDQSSFLVAPNGQSKREHIYIWTQTELAAIRIREYKMHFQATQELSDFMGIDYSIKQQVGLSPWLFNLYIDPKEEMPLGHRLNPWLASIAADAKEHIKTLKQFPPKDVGLKQ